MKKLMVILTVIAIQVHAGSIGKVNFLIESSLSKNYDLIKSHSDSLSDEERYKLYESNKSKVFWPIILNAFTVPGIGSAIQKDYVAAPAMFVSYAAGFAFIMSAGSLEEPTKNVGIYYGNDNLYNKDFDTYDSKRKTRIISGGILLGGSWIFGIVRPLIFSSNYNTKLGEALNFSSKTHLSLIPIIEDKNVTMQLSYRVQF
jgi:hypothetical protein